MSEPLIELRGLRTWFSQRRTFGPAVVVKAVDGVDLTIRRGEVLGLVGESGSGKTTLGRSILQLARPTAGQVLYDGTDLASLGPRALRGYRRRMQVVFQDPYASLSPRMSVRDLIAEPLDIHAIGTRRQRDARVAELLDLVGLRPEHAGRHPHEFSGGQRQRIGIARALAVDPEFIVADEPVSALDVSIQAQVLNLLADLRERMALTMLFVTHDLGVVDYVSDRVAVMYLGRIMEIAPAGRLHVAGRHPYTRALLAAVPVAHPRDRRARPRLAGDPPSPIDPPSGCVFRTRCPLAGPECAREVPARRSVGPDHEVACLKVDAAAPAGTGAVRSDAA